MSADMSKVRFQLINVITAPRGIEDFEKRAKEICLEILVELIETREHRETCELLRTLL